MTKKPRKHLRQRPHLHSHTDLVHSEIATQTPIIPQRDAETESGRHRILETRERVGGRTDRELHSDCFPAEPRR